MLSFLLCVACVESFSLARPWHVTVGTPLQTTGVARNAQEPPRDSSTSTGRRLSGRDKPRAQRKVAELEGQLKSHDHISVLLVDGNNLRARHRGAFGSLLSVVESLGALAVAVGLEGRLIAVFDHGAAARVTSHSNITVVMSGPDEKADDTIVRLLRQLRGAVMPPVAVSVVTADAGLMARCSAVVRETSGSAMDSALASTADGSGGGDTGGDGNGDTHRAQSSIVNPITLSWPTEGLELVRGPPPAQLPRREGMAGRQRLAKELDRALVVAHLAAPPAAFTYTASPEAPGAMAVRSIAS